ncbi:beta-glucosidase [Listeria floridensis FSL S10-1187]|uniref:Beta-glucosidase n=1 Tax=Listeria floridensis FSL S10-1187 TaxID=1265817 RepID=A0ABN0RDF4_9LIST|nr:fibronectin type III-like domain-contianing protein [Listeria floridensis]EUJ29129.1 beta-glucosidase [Listeria floridensis FSL S10-1187]
MDLSFDQDVKALLHGYLSGQAGAKAMLDLVTGKVAPSGKLNETYPHKLEDTVLGHDFPVETKEVFYHESLFVGYRYYQTAEVGVKYPFGFGKSYSSFRYSELKVRQNGVEFTLENTGDCAAAEVVQLYISSESNAVFRPQRELKNFQKHFLDKGESKTIFLAFDEYTFRYFDKQTHRFEIEAGDYHIEIGASSADIRLSGSIHQSGTLAAQPDQTKRYPHYFSGKVKQLPLGEFETLLDKKITDIEAENSAGDLLIENDPLSAMKQSKSILARLSYRFLNAKKKAQYCAGQA